MQKLKKLLPLWVAFGILLVVGGIVFGLDRLQQQNARKNAAPVIVPLEDGVWKLHPTREPERIYEWQGEEHFIYDFSSQYLIFFDDDSAWVYDAETDTTYLHSTGLNIDYSLGCAGIAVHHSVDFTFLYFPPEEAQWISVDWCDQKIKARTAVTVPPYGKSYERVLPFCGEARGAISSDNHFLDLFTVTMREDGKYCTVRSYGANHSAQHSNWIDLGPYDRLACFKKRNQLTQFSDASVTITKYTLLDHIPDTMTYTADNCPPLKHQWHLASEDQWYYLTDDGELFFYDGRDEERIDRHADLTAAELSQATSFRDTLQIPTREGIRVYAYFHRCGWTRFDLAVGLD